MSMIEDLYRGNNPVEQNIIPKTKRYQEARKRAYGISDVLESQLTEPQQKLLDEYLSADAAMTDLEHLEFYRQGLILGVRLMLEILGQGKAQ